MSRAERSSPDWDPAFFGRRPSPPPHLATPRLRDSQRSRDLLSSSDEPTPAVFKLLPKAAPALELAPEREPKGWHEALIRRPARPPPRRKTREESGLSRLPESRRLPREEPRPIRTTVRAAPPPPPHRPSKVPRRETAAAASLPALSVRPPARPDGAALRDPVPVKAVVPDVVRKAASPAHAKDAGVPRVDSIAERLSRTRETPADETRQTLRALRRIQALQVWTLALVLAFAFGGGYLLRRELAPARAQQEWPPRLPEVENARAEPRRGLVSIPLGGERDESLRHARRVAVEDLPLERRR